MLRTRLWRPVGEGNQSRVAANQANIGDTVRVAEARRGDRRINRPGPELA